MFFTAVKNCSILHGRVFVMKTLPDPKSRSSVSSTEQRLNIHSHRNATLKVLLNLNARSIKAQDNLYQFDAMLYQISQDIGTCTESWLSSDIFDAEVNPDNLGFTMFRRDQGSRGGGVFMLVKKPTCILLAGSKTGCLIVKFYGPDCNDLGQSFII